MSIVFSCDVILCGWLCSKYQLTNKQKNSNLVLWFIIMSQSVMQKQQQQQPKNKDLLFSRSRSLQELIWSKYDKFYCIFWIDDFFFSTKLGLIKHYHKPECYMEKLDCCVQGQGHNNTSKYQWMFIQMMFSESLNLLLPNLVWWCIILSQIVFQKDWFAVFKVKVTVKNI